MSDAPRPAPPSASTPSASTPSASTPSASTPSASTPSRRPSRHRVTVAALSLALVAGSTTAAAAITPAPQDKPQSPTVDVTPQVVDLTFPVADPGTDVSFIDDFLYLRGGGSRLHAATDVMAPKHRAVHAAVGGTIGWIPVEEPTYGWMMDVRGDDGRRYVYVHLNDDTPIRDADGRWLDDDAGGMEHAYAPRIVEAIKEHGTARGLRVERGELLGWLGDSGNAKGVASHLHFEIHMASEEYGEYRINPYHGLVDALARDDVPGSELSEPGFDGTYEDVDPESTHAAAIDELTARGIAFGCTEVAYCPAEAITRGEVAAYLAGALGLDTDGTSAPFEDVEGTHPHVGAIAAVDAAGVLRGYGDGRFGPDTPLSREQLASVLVHGFAVPAASAPAPFDDVRPDGTHAASIAAASEAGLTFGCRDGTVFCRTDTVDRAQAASFVLRGMQPR